MKLTILSLLAASFSAYICSVLSKERQHCGENDVFRAIYRINVMKKQTKES